MAASSDEQVVFRASPELIAAIDREVATRNAARPGERLTRSSVIRALLYGVLFAQPEEPKAPAKKAPSKKAPAKKRAR